MPEHTEPAGESWPVVVVGAGVAGCAAAITLARRGVRTLLLETQAQPGFQIGEGLPAAAGPLLRDLGLLQGFEAAGHLPCWGTVSRWGSSDPFVKDSIMDRNGHGWQLDRVRFNEGMREAAVASGVELRLVDGVHQITQEASGGWRLAAGAVIQAAWLIDATGRRSTVARLLGARRQGVDTLVAQFTALAPGPFSSDRDSRTHIESTPDGWWYSALTPSGRRVVACLTDADLLPADDLAARLMQTRGMAELAGSYAPPSEWHTTSAQSDRIDPLMGERWIAVGDAALSFDPLSSQGLLTALYTGLRGGEAVATSLAGDPRPMTAFRTRLETIWDTYLTNRTSHYQLETRWADRPFWQRRSGASKLA